MSILYGCSISEQELRILADLTVRLTEIRQRGCGHLSVENFATRLFLTILKNYSLARKTTRPYRADAA